MSLVVWTMFGIAVWHFAVLVPDKFWGGIAGALLAAVIGAVLAGYALPTPGLPAASPPGIPQGLLALPGALAGLGLSYWYGARRRDEVRAAARRASRSRLSRVAADGRGSARDRQLRPGAATADGESCPYAPSAQRGTLTAIGQLTGGWQWVCSRDSDRTAARRNPRRSRARDADSA